MPRPVGYGRPGTKVIPDDWQTTQGAVVDSTHDCTVTVGPTGIQRRWNPETSQSETVPVDPVYAGAATVTPVIETTGQPILAQDEVPTRRYEVKLTQAAAGVEVGHVVRISVSPDPDLVGTVLTVTSVEAASRRFSRVLQAVLTN